MASCIARIFHQLFPTGYVPEFKALLALAWPTTVTSFTRFFLLSVSVIMCGHLDKTQLDAAALANSLIAVFGLAINMGFSTACDTLFSQTYGSRNKKRVGLYLQRSFLVALPVLMILSAIHLNVEPLLLLLGQQAQISNMAARYCLLFLPGLYFDCGLIIMARYLQNQGIVYPSMVCGIIGNIFNAVSQYVAIYVLCYDYQASAVCQACSVILVFCLTLGYILKSKAYVKTWDGWKWGEIFYDFGGFYLLAISGILMISFEEWSFEAGTFVAGYLGTVQLGAQSVTFQLEGLTYMIPQGLAVAVNVRVGNQLGAGNPMGARTSYRVGMTIIIMSATIMAVICMLFSPYLAAIFTNDKSVIDMASDVIKLLGIFQYFDGIMAVSGGALRGCGRQLLGSVMVFIGFYVLGLPIGISLALLTPLEVLGMWLGLVIGLGIEAFGFIAIVHKTDWEMQSQKARMRVGDFDAEKSKLEEDQEEDYLEFEENDETESLLRTHRRQVSSVSGNRHIGTVVVPKPFPESMETPPISTASLVFRRSLLFGLVAAILAGSAIYRIISDRPYLPTSCENLQMSTEYYNGSSTAPYCDDLTTCMMKN